jgi:hypothetical protein
MRNGRGGGGEKECEEGGRKERRKKIPGSNIPCDGVRQQFGQRHTWPGLP